MSDTVRNVTRGPRPALPGTQPTQARDNEAMIRVDHAGEFGALRIYEGQLAVLSRTHAGSADVAAIRQMAAQEQKHFDVFDRMIKDREFDVSEMAIVTHLQGKEFGEPFTAIPVFPLRAFPHATLQYNVKSGVQSPRDLEGKKIGTITGFSFIPELKSIKDLQLSLYDTSDAAVRDLIAGRIDAVIGDPPVVSYAIKQNPDWNMHFLAFTDNSADFPLLTGLGQVVYGLNQKNDDLRQKMDAIIADMWKTCEMKEIGARYGLSSDVWFKPVGQNFRAGVDRPADYKLPSCAAGG